MPFLSKFWPFADADFIRWLLNAVSRTPLVIGHPPKLGAYAIDNSKVVTGGIFTFLSYAILYEDGGFRWERIRTVKGKADDRTIGIEAIGRSGG